VLNLEVKDVVLIVECGGATVDHQAYELTSASPCSFPKLILSSGRHLQVRSSPPPLCVFHWVGLIADTVKPVVLRYFATAVHTRFKMAFTCRLEGLLAGLMLCKSPLWSFIGESKSTSQTLARTGL